MIAAKPHREYDQQLALLLSRGMVINDNDRAMRKLSQVGYYRLSGFWYTSRIIRNNDDGFSFRSDEFLPGTSFEQTWDLYIFDKKLRLLMMDALERIEIHIRAVIAHEVGRNDPLAYRNPAYINQRFLSESSVNTFNKWLAKLDKKIKESRDECIIWYLVRLIGPRSTWAKQVADHFDTKPNMPGCSYTAMGVPASGFPRARFSNERGFTDSGNKRGH